MYRTTVIVLASALLWALPAAAQSAAPIQSAPLAPATDNTPSDHLLLLELPDPADHRLELEVRYLVGEEILFAERLITAPVDAADLAGSAPVAVELLAWHPQVRQQILARAADGDRVTVQVGAGTAPILSTTVFDLLLAARVLRRGELVTPQTRSVVLADALSTGPTGQSFLVTKGTCEDTCYREFRSCESDCGIDDQCIWYCELVRDHCLLDCETCTEPTIEEWTTTTLVSWTYYGPTECDGPLHGTGKEARWGYMKLKYTDYRKTTYCDGTSTTEVIGVSYWEGFCWRLFFIYQCSPGDGYHANLCPAH